MIPRDHPERDALLRIAAKRGCDPMVVARAWDSARLGQDEGFEVLFAARPLWIYGGAQTSKGKQYRLLAALYELAGDK